MVPTTKRLRRALPFDPGAIGCEARVPCVVPFKFAPRADRRPGAAAASPYCGGGRLAENFLRGRDA